jgi:arginase
MKTLNIVGYAYGQAAGDTGCADGPDQFKESPAYHSLITQYPAATWDATFHPTPGISDKLLQTRDICQKLADKTRELTLNNEFFVVLGGDHSCAIGTWSGVHAALYKKGPIGLIWVDAHMDSHTPETSPSNNIHGMPLAALLGYGHAELASLIQPKPKLLPEHICLIGIRSFEPDEAALLSQLGVRIFSMEEVDQRGLADVFTEALSIVQKNTIGFGVSIDLDAIDPSEVPGVGTPAEHGLSAPALFKAVSNLTENPNFLGAEIVEFNPHHDEHHKTEKVISTLINSILGG